MANLIHGERWPPGLAGRPLQRFVGARAGPAPVGAARHEVAGCVKPLADERYRCKPPSFAARRVRRRPAADRLLCETVDEEPTERVRWILDAAYALSGEICEACGGPGDPVRTAAGRQTTRCADCREPADDSLARPPWRREREPEEDQQAPVRGFLIGSNRRTLPVVDDLVGTEDLAALMEAWYTPATHRGWPR